MTIPATAITTPATSRFNDSVKWVGGEQRIYRVTRTFPDSPRPEIAIDIPAHHLPRYTGSHSWSVCSEIVLECTRPALNRLTEVDAIIHGENQP